MLAVEQDFLVTIPLHTPIAATGDTEYVARGAIDRIEIDADGRVHLIDFKTARRPPTGPEVSMDPQLGLYQQAVRHGALADVDADADCAGAALVQLRCDERGSAGEPRVQEQAELGMGPVPWMDDDIAAAIVRIRSEDFPAIPSSECRNCPYRVACPAQSEGREVSR
jgi:RecB family exonuclease